MNVVAPSNVLEALSDNIRIDPTSCVFCGVCVEHCVLDNLRMREAPCRAACPLGVNVQGFVQLAARGHDDRAREMVRRVLPFAAIACRVCDRPCEAACLRRTVDGKSVAINDIKRALFEDAPIVMAAAAAPTGKSVGIVGSGPAGLMAAHDLALAGHAVTIYEAEDRPGGLLRSVIPVYRLPEAVLDATLAALEAIGIAFVCRARVGAAEHMEELCRRHDALVVAPGFGGDRHLGLAGEEAEGVHHAMELLCAVRRGEDPALRGTVLVVGGGHAALDAASIALRQGAESVTVVYRRTRKHFHASDEDIDRARQEGVRFAFTWTPAALRLEGGHVCGLECVHDMALLDADCSDYPDFSPAERRCMPADQIIVAVGQEDGGMARALCGPGEPDPITLRWAEEKIFVAGDAVDGPSSVVQAMAGGRQAAESVRRLLAGEDLHYGRTYRGPFEPVESAPATSAVDVPRQRAEHRIPQGRGDYAEAVAALNPAQARLEASRCLSCGGPEGRYKTCWFCLPCEVECPEQALRVEIPYLLR